MTTDEKQILKKQIETEIETLSQEIEKIKKALYPDKEQGITDKVAHLNFKLDQAIHLQRHDEAIKRLNRLKHAFLKIDRPDYGICQECEEEIPFARLQIMPESLYCVSCMEELGL